MASRRRISIGLVTAVASLVGGLAIGTGVASAAPIAQLPTADPANFTPNVLDGEVDSIWQVGTKLIAGGTFTQVANAPSNGGATYNRTKLVSFTATTGVVDTAFAPVFNGNVTSVIPASDGTSIYVAGNFTTVNGVNRSRLARINVSNGALVTTFNAGTINSNIRDMRLFGDQLYIGGAFTTVAGQQRGGLASLNPATGAVTTKLGLALSGTQNGGTTTVFHMDVTPAGDRLVVIGNFAQIAGQDRRQVGMIDLSTTPATVNAWQTTFYTTACANAFDAYIRDVDFAEDGSFLIVTTTGAYKANTGCDTISRFPTYTAQAGLAPAWTTYTGGDTSYAVEIHSGVAYVGGHQRWFNNPFAADSAGPGAIPRQGMAALDVINGLPYSWNPGRDRGVGLFDYFVTSAGLWAGSDTDHWAGELHQRLAFFPWAGGKTIDESAIAGLPGEVYLLGRTSGTSDQQDQVQHRTYTGTGAPGATTTSAGTVQWRNVRASFMVNDTLYTLNSDGTFQTRTFNGTFGTATTVNLYANNIIADAPNVSGMFFDPATSRIYYTMTGSSSLYYRYFTPESNVIGATRFTATGTVSSLNPSRVRGMFLAGGNIYFGDNTSGNLLRIGFANAAITGTAATADTTVDWRGRAMFLDGAPVVTPANSPPTAAFTRTCNLLQCTFNATTSSDTDGTVVSYAWTFGDGQTGTGVNPSHTYASANTYSVGLTVTDDDSATGTTSVQVAVSGPGNTPPVAAFTSSCTQLACTFNGSTSTDNGTITNYAWTFGEGSPVSGASSSASHTYAAAGTYPITLVVTDNNGVTDDATGTVTVSNAVATVAFRASANANTTGAAASVVVPAAVQSGDQLVLLVTSNIATTITTPAGWTLLGTQQDGTPDMRSWAFTTTAGATTAGSTVTATLGDATAKSSRILLAYSGAAVPTVAASSVQTGTAATLASPTVAVATSGSLVVGYWTDKTAANTGWTLPGSVTSRASSVGSGSGRIVAVAGDSPANAGTYPGATATSATSGAKAIAFSIVIPPA